MHENVTDSSGQCKNERVIPRYSLPEMATLWTDQARFTKWLEIEVLAVEAWAKLGVIPAQDAADARSKMPVVDAAFEEAVLERERITDHDVAAFVDIVQAKIGGTAGPWIHYGLTSSDVVDTALCSTLSNAAELLLRASTELVESLRVRAEEFRDTACVGRTHGIHAEPTTFGAKLALWCLQVDRDRARLSRAMQAISVGKLSGAVGTYSNIDPTVEEYVCGALGLKAVPATQVISRDRHAEFVTACAAVGATMEMIATEIRHLQRTEVGEAREPFRAGQKGSSAMPHKRNPITCERLCGLARLLRGYVSPAYENVALWHERDISHSSIERVMLPDVSMLTYYMLVKTKYVIDGLVVDAPRMIRNLDASFGLVFSQSVLLALIEAGLTRDVAYRIVQRNAMAAWDTQTNFRVLLEADAEVTAQVDRDVLDRAFDLSRVLKHAGHSIDVLAEVEGPNAWR